jgi:hypothetical protein
MRAWLLVAACILLIVGQSRAQSESDFRAWLRADPERAGEVTEFERYLRQSGVDGVLATDQLLRNATSWQRCKLDWSYSMPPRALWGHIVPTLRFIRDEVVPRIGPVSVESGYREPKLNRCAGGAPLSAHAQFQALDLIPERAMTRRELISAVCKLHRGHGQAFHIGLGFYDGLRFHVDSKSFRRWGSDNHGTTSPCNSAVERFNAG